jgi:hypothetical protein
MRELIVLTLVVVVSSSCSTASPTAPTAPSSQPNPSRLTNIGGVVRDSVQRPVAGARIEVLDGPLIGQVTTTNIDGTFSLAQPVAEAVMVTLRLTKEGYSPANVAVRGTADLRIYLRALTLIDLSGRYTVTLAAAAECSQLDPTVSRRAHVMTFKSVPNNPILFTGDLSGAEFYPGYDTLFAVVADDTVRFFVSSWDAFNWWLEDHPIYERLSSGGFLAVMGAATAMNVTSDGSMSATFEGSLSYCGAARDSMNAQWPPECSVPVVTCHSPRHHLALSR